MAPWTGVTSPCRATAVEEIERAEKEECGEYRLPKELEDRENLRQTIKAALAEMDSIERDHLHPDDKGARMMKVEGKKAFGYNAQVVDSQSGLIVGEGVVNQEDDTHLLTQMIATLEENAGSAAQETVADLPHFALMRKHGMADIPMFVLW